MPLRHLYRGILKTVIWIVSAAVFGFCTIAVYLIVMAENPDSYLPGKSAVAIRGDAISQYPEKKWDRLYPGFSAIYPEAAILIKTFRTIRSKMPGLFRKLSPAADSAYTLCISRKKGTLLVIDLGWKSILFSASSFIVRSAFTPEGHVRFSSREVNCAGRIRTLYNIRFREKGATLHLAQNRNLLLLSLSGDEIIRAFTTKREGSALVQDSTYNKAVSRAGRSSALTLLFRTPFRPHPKHAPFIPFPGKKWTAITADRRGGVRGSITFGKKTGLKYPVFHRLLHSNNFIPTSSGIALLDTIGTIEILLFDDIQELLNIRRLKKLPANLCRYSANEAGAVRTAGGWRVYLRLLSTSYGNKIRKLTTKKFFLRQLAPLTTLFRLPPPKNVEIKNNVVWCGRGAAISGDKPRRKREIRKLYATGLLPANYLKIKNTGHLLIGTAFRFRDGTIQFRKTSWPIRTKR